MEQLARIPLRHDRVEIPAAEEVGENRRDLAGLVLQAALLGLDEALAGIQRQDAAPSGEQKVGLAVAVHVGHREMVPLELRADPVRTEAGLFGNVLEKRDDGQARLARLKIKRPIAAALADLHHELVLAGLELERQLGAIGRACALHVLAENLLAVQEDLERVVAAERDGQFDRIGGFDLAIDVTDDVFIVVVAEQPQIVDLPVGKAAVFPDRLFAVLAVVLLGEVDFLLRRKLLVKRGGPARVVERADAFPLAEFRRRAGLHKIGRDNIAI